MERVSGEPIKKHLQNMLREWAESQGKSLEEVKADMKKVYEDPEKLREALRAGPTSARMMDIAIGMLCVNVYRPIHFIQ